MAVQHHSAVDSDVGIETLTEMEARAVFDRVARRRLNMGSDEFLRRWDAGEFREADERVGLEELLLLLPLVR